ncbi:hypothetical protein D3C80_1693550 [compost metagenome]
MILVLLGRVIGPGVAEMVVAAVRPMKLIKVHIICLQPLEAGVDRLVDALGCRRVAVADIGAAGAGDLGRNDDLIAPAAPDQPFADEAFRVAIGLWRKRGRGVEFGRIDEVDALVEGVIQLLVRLGDGVL